ncbi:carboxymuconolactone decarboxylase family protein [Novispirillum itersonii]|uniref:carboxymuconolactone decarboxylase family protein n=1 Tax=Novispirillum itersonii TaxID=189 RepID=UPI0003764ABC|nr:carboxymuconolactone decarboxylase family protein [Novispirillum itersonii]
MSRLPSLAADAVPAEALTLFAQIRKAAGMLPNAYAVIGGHSPAALALLLSGDAALSKGTLSRADIEAVRLAVSALNGCDYCVAAHALIGEKSGLSREATRALRAGRAQTGDSRRDALVQFALTVAGTRGTVPEAAVQAVIQAGVTPAQVIETLLVIALITMTNLVNRVNDTAVDFPLPQ